MESEVGNNGKWFETRELMILSLTNNIHQSVTSPKNFGGSWSRGSYGGRSVDGGAG